jgi:hypothetical protein
MPVKQLPGEEEKVEGISKKNMHFVVKNACLHVEVML